MTQMINVVARVEFYFIQSNFWFLILWFKSNARWRNICYTDDLSYVEFTFVSLLFIMFRIKAWRIPKNRWPGSDPIKNVIIWIIEICQLTHWRNVTNTTLQRFCWNFLNVIRSCTIKLLSKFEWCNFAKTFVDFLLIFVKWSFTVAD